MDDIEFDAIKIGMLGTVQIIDCVADVLKKKNKGNKAFEDYKEDKRYRSGAIHYLAGR